MTESQILAVVSLLRDCPSMIEHVRQVASGPDLDRIELLRRIESMKETA